MRDQTGWYGRALEQAAEEKERDRQLEKTRRHAEASKRIRVVCLECGARFSTTSMLPECPRCGGSDIDVR